MSHNKCVNFLKSLLLVYLVHLLSMISSLVTYRFLDDGFMKKKCTNWQIINKWVKISLHKKIGVFDIHTRIQECSKTITVTSYMSVMVSQTPSQSSVCFMDHFVYAPSQRKTPWLCICTEWTRQFVQINTNPYYWPFVKGTHRWPVESLHKGPVMY